MEDGRMLYAGKYNAPDYERILSGSCDLAVESTMIYHSPEVKEQLERLGIPVLVERSSYERHPLGRMEWLKLYGAGPGGTGKQLFCRTGEAAGTCHGSGEYRKNSSIFLYQFQRLCQCQEVRGLCG